jgi:tRNA(adenine34) deaminase
MDKQAQRFLAHAEFMALDQADRLNPFPGNRRDARLFTTLEPCIMCMGAAMSFFIGEVTYALESPADGGAALVTSWQPGADTMPSYKVPDIKSGLMREESKALFRRYVEVHPPDSPLWEWAKSLTELP